MTTNEVLEELANIEHEQWMSWSKTALIKMKALESNEPDAFENAIYWLQDHWQKNWKSYPELPEDTKEHDREWARKVKAIIEREVSLARQDEAKKIFALADGEPDDKDSPVRRVSKHSGIDTRTIKAVVAVLKKECGVE